MFFRRGQGLHGLLARRRSPTMVTHAGRGARLLVLLVIATVTVAGCTELRGRRRVREGNRLYREGHYAEALTQFRLAEDLTPALPLLWLNEGLTCRQLLLPGSKSREAEDALTCAIRAFDHMKDVAPADPRAEQLYMQTLFDGDRMDMLAARYGSQLKRNPDDLAAINGLVQVYSRWNRPEEALRWYQRKAELLPRDPEAQYSVGVFVWQQLFQRGGGPDKATFDPRLDPADAAAANNPPPGRKHRGKLAVPPPPRKAPPPFALGDISGPARAQQADLGIRYLERALALRPTYRDAMIYLNLLYRQKSMAFFEDPVQWQAAVTSAEHWRHEVSAGAPAGATTATAASVTSPTPSSASASSSGSAAAAGGASPERVTN